MVSFGFMLRSKCFLCSLKCALNINPSAKPTPLAVLPLKLLLKAREQPCKALALDGFAGLDCRIGRLQKCLENEGLMKSSASLIAGFHLLH